MRTVADLFILIFPAPVLCIEGPVITGSSMSSRSDRETLERRMPIWTKTIPLASGLELMVPFTLRLKTFTASPRETSLAVRVDFFFSGVFKAIFLPAESIFLRSSVRFFSSSLADMVSCPALLKIFMVWSAYSLASLKIRCASSLAS